MGSKKKRSIFTKNLSTNSTASSQSSLNQHESLLLLIKKLQKRIEEMEASRFWKFRKLYYRIRSIVKSSDGHKRNKTVVGKILFFFSLRGRTLIRKFFLYIFKHLYLWLEDKRVSIIVINPEAFSFHQVQTPYEKWKMKNLPRAMDLLDYKSNLPFLSYQPLVSLIVPVYNTPVSFLMAMVESVQNQVYSNWELCIADDASTDTRTIEALKKMANMDARIKIIFRSENGHISACSNSAFALAMGEYIGLLDHDDLLAPDALYEVVKLLNIKPDADFIYSDEDKINEEGNFTEPHFKPEWCPENLLSRNYISHFAVIRTALMQTIKGFREGFEGSQDYDLYLRLTEITQNIYHIPKVLYHWRMHQGSVASNAGNKNYAFESGVKALNEALQRRTLPGHVTLYNGLPGYYSISLEVQSPKKVSIIIATKDKASVLKTCLDSIYQKSTYQNFEIILISNNSIEKETEELLNEYQSLHLNFIPFVHNIPFNFSILMNFGVSKANGDFLMFLNNDTEIVTPNWMEQLIGHCQRPEIGVVGAKLLYPDDTIQHAGVIIGMGGAAGHGMVRKHWDDTGYYANLICLSNYSALTGAAFMCRKEAFDSIKSFDENYEVEYNDIDFCLRIKEQGYRNIYVPEVVLYHHESLTRGNPFATDKSRERNKYEVTRFKKRWKYYVENDPCYSRHLSLDYTDFRIRE
jgi:O-antigen biosynthesis protein